MLTSPRSLACHVSGLRIPIKCFRAWAAFKRRRKFLRHRRMLATGALHLRPRAIRVLSRVAHILHSFEVEALDGAMPLLPTWEVDPAACGGARVGEQAPTTLEYDSVAEKHCTRLSTAIHALLQRVAMAIDEEWLTLNWMQARASP